ncbi:MAG TPA: CshA/CshB family fibrillar adhesin-related protein [Kofleriaceae bacterium]
MSPGIIAAIVIGALAAISAAVAANRKAGTLSQLHAVPSVTVAAASVGQAVRLTGLVAGDGEQRVTGAFSGTPGVIAVSERWEKTTRGQRLRRLDRTLRGTPFILEDETGRVRVIADDSVEVVVDLVPAQIATSGPNRVFGAGVMAANMNQTTETLEGVIAVGARVTVSGTLRKHDDGTLELVAAPKLIVATV